MVHRWLTLRRHCRLICYRRGSRHPDAEMVLVTGDCVHVYPLDEGFEPEGEEAYQLLRSLVEARFPAATVRALPGNHDSRAALSAVFPESVGGSAATVPPTGLHCFAELMGCWLVLGCDSQSGDPHDPAGEGDISFAQLSWLRSVVRTHLASSHVDPLHGRSSFSPLFVAGSSPPTLRRRPSSACITHRLRARSLSPSVGRTRWSRSSRVSLR